MDTIQVRFRKKYHQYLMEALVVAIFAHLLVFYFAPPFEFTPYLPMDKGTTIIVDEPEPVPIIEEPKEVIQPKIEHVPIINEEPGADDVDMPVTSPADIRDLAILPLPTQEKPGFIVWDSMPMLLKAFSPVYPELARQGGFEGKVLLRVTIGADGRVEAASIINSEVPPLMEKAALNAVMKFEFEPAMQRNIPVRSIMAVPVVFRLR
ncbi:MAG: TonB family protein [Candidatus Krumholzibacteriota bacterium]|nr:TonB family protein [Candidatus Krumholzibacteriota bacterium]